MVTFAEFGPTAWLIDDVADPAAWAAGLDAADVTGVEDVVPAESSVVVITSRSAHREVGACLASVMPLGGHEDAETVEIEVVYDGEDLEAVARAIGRPIEQVIALHEGGTYTVAFCGFSPGFAYLRGLAPELHLPRREQPRTRVPAGAVAIAAGYSAVYPSGSPGGWHLLGRTTTRVWDERAHPPTLLRPGARVRFRSS